MNFYLFFSSMLVIYFDVFVYVLSGFLKDYE